MSQPRLCRHVAHLCGIALLYISASQIALAQSTDDFDIYDIPDEIIVQGVQIKIFDTQKDTAPDVSFSQRDILALAALDIGELIDSIEIEIRTNSDEPTIYLLNGRPVADRSQIDDFPAEAVQKIEVLPPEAALKYSSSPDRRVVNFILRPKFKSITTTLKGRTTTEGGAHFGSLKASRLKIKDEKRFAYDAAYNHTDNLTQAEREIAKRESRNPFSRAGTITAASLGDEIDPALSGLLGRQVTSTQVPDSARSGSPSLEDFVAGAGQTPIDNPQDFRDLTPEVEKISLGASAYIPLGNRLSGSASLQTDFTQSVTQSGLLGTRLRLRPSNPFSPFSDNVSLYRYDGPLKREEQKDDIQANISLFGDFPDWRWSVQAQYEHVDEDRDTERKIDIAPVQRRLNRGDPELNA